MIVNSTRREWAEAVDELLSIVPLRELQSPQAKQYLERIVFDRYCPVSVIGIRGKAGLFLLYSNLDQMEKTKKYWFWDDRTRREFPFPLYSFEQFCAEVPDWYAEYERAFDHLRWEVKAAIPAKGSRIALGDRIRCMNVRGQLGELLDNSGRKKGRWTLPATPTHHSMTDTPPTTPKPRRSWLQFSLRTLMVLMLVVGPGFGWFAREVQRARARREAAKTIEKLGGRVTWQPPSGGIVQTAVTWVEKLFGEDFSGDVGNRKRCQEPFRCPVWAKTAELSG